MKRRSMKLGALLLAALVILGCFLAGVERLSVGQRAEGKTQLEEALRRTAAACYALEGVYPPDLAYMQKHYGIHFDEERYAVVYRVEASNLMPDITVLEIDHEE